MSNEKLEMKNEERKMKNEPRRTQRTRRKNKFSNQNSVFSVYSVVLFFLFFIFSACHDPLTSSQSTTLPPGKGSFSLSISVARTILPDTPTEFASYTLAFTATNGGTSLGVDRSSDQLSDPVYLEPGTYDLEVTAYFDTDKTQIAAQGSAEGLVINEGESTSQVIILKVIVGEGRGAFTYNVRFPAGLATAGLKVTPLNAVTGSPERNANFLSGGDTYATDTLSLNSGYYNVVLTLIKNNGDTLIWRELLHVYSNLESFFAMEFYDGDFYRTKYTVTFVFDNGDEDGVFDVIHGYTAEEKKPQDPSKDGYTFGGWYSDSDLSNEYVFNTPVVSDLTLYAKWNIIPVTNITGVPTTATAGTPLTLSGTVSPSNATYQTTVWNVTDAGTTGATLSGVNYNTLNTTAAGTVTVTATITDGTAQGTDYTQDFEITVTQPVTGVTLSPTTLNLTLGGATGTLTATVLPANASNKTVTWSISPSGIATVSNGTVTALAAGTAIITATSVSDTSKTASCTVTVNPKPVTITGLTAANKFYDGTTTATITGTATINGLIGGDSVNVSDGTAVFENATVGYNKTVTFSGFSLTGADVGNYTLLSQPTNVTASIVEKPVMVQITAGTFQMGSPENELGRTEYEIQHSVTLANSFYMGKYQVTQVQYQVVMGSNPSNFYWNPATGEIQGYRPVERVSWYDALVFCNKLSVMEGLTPAYSIDGSTDPAAWGTVPTSSDATWNTVSIVAGSTGYRLPTEAQWEYACRAGTTTAYNLGDTWNDDWGWIVTNSNDMTHEVGKKLPNTWGLYDMHGNTRDWCWDWHSPFYYTNSPTNDPQGASSGANRVLRGGYYPLPAQYSRSASRDGAPPSQRSVNIGFRLIRP